MKIPVHPGKLLKEVLEERGITEAELADMTKLSRALVSAIIHENRRITPQTALLISRLLGGSPRAWLDAQIDHDLHSAQGDLSRRLERIIPLAQT